MTSAITCRVVTLACAAALVCTYLVSTASTASAAPSQRHPICSTHHSAHTIAKCLRGSLTEFWSGELNNYITEPVHIEATRSDVPKSCRPGITSAPAFTCKANLELYINKGLLHVIDKYFSPAYRRFAFASVQSHEIGHVLQYTLHQPQIEHTHPTLKQIRYVEQQADCLSGVWAHHQSSLNEHTFRHEAYKLIKLVSSNAEIETHGTPKQRLAALDRGLESGRPQSCHLVTFS